MRHKRHVAHARPGHLYSLSRTFGAQGPLSFPSTHRTDLLGEAVVEALLSHCAVQVFERCARSSALGVRLLGERPMLVSGNALLPRADQLVRDNELVQEHIRKKLQKQDSWTSNFIRVPSI